MTRTLFACMAVALFGASAVLAASPEVDKAIKTIQSVTADPAKMKLFCNLDEDDDEGDASAGKAAAPEKEDAAAAKEDAAADKEEDTMISQLGKDFEAAWDVGGGLDENSADSKEFAAAVDAIMAKCE